MFASQRPKPKSVKSDEIYATQTVVTAWFSDCGVPQHMQGWMAHLQYVHCSTRVVGRFYSAVLSSL
jgi:hypothetical protein